MLRKLILTIAAATIAAAPVTAQAAPARIASPVGETEELGGALLPVLVAIGLGLLLVLLIDNNDDQPMSP